MKPLDKKHLRLRHNTWGLYYRLPKRLKELPESSGHPDPYIKSLGTDSIVTARRLRDRIIYNLNKAADDSNNDWEKEILRESEQFNKDHPHIDDPEFYRNLQIDKVIDEAAMHAGVDPETGHATSFTKKQQERLDILQGKKPAKETP